MVAWFYYVAIAMVRVLLVLFTRWRVEGRENIATKGPLLVVANHIHLADPPVVGASLGRKAIFMAKQELFRSRFSGYFMRGCGAFPVHRGQLDRKALHQAKGVLAKGMVLVMFPEGTRSKNAKLQPAFSGSALVALRSDVPIIPVGITGTENIRGAAWWLRRPRITVNIGRPFRLPSVNGKLSKEKLEELTNYMMEHIAELLPLEYRGSYAGRVDGVKD